jgi:surface protein
LAITTINIVDKYAPTGTEIESWDASAAQDGSLMAYVLSDGATLTIAGNGSGEIYANENSDSMFGNTSSGLVFSKLEQIINFNLINTKNVTDIAQMFAVCVKLKTINLNNIDTRNVISMSYMFYLNSELTTLNLSKFDTTNATGMVHFAAACKNVTSIFLNENFGKSSLNFLAGAGNGMFYVNTGTPIKTTVYNANAAMKAYDWAADNRDVTFVD